MRTLGFILAATLLAGGSPPAPGIDDLGWLAGHWRGTKGKTTSEELWTAPAGGMMLGLHRDLREGGGKAFFEYLRIEQTDEGIVFLASPSGKPPTPFPLVELEGTRVVFANPDHDWPQRIIYKRVDVEDGSVLFVRAEGGERALEWEWTLVASD